MCHVPICVFLQIQIPDEPLPEKEKKTEAIKAFFLKLAGDDEEVDWMELKDILDYAMRNGKPERVNRTYSLPYFVT